MLEVEIITTRGWGGYKLFMFAKCFETCGWPEKGTWLLSYRTTQCLGLEVPREGEVHVGDTLVASAALSPKGKFPPKSLG